MRLVKFTANMRFLSFLLLLYAGVVTSCDLWEQKADEAVEVSVSKSPVNFGATQQWVVVKCSGSWTLSLTSDDGEVDWARLDVTSGVGDRQNVRITCQANETGHSRDLMIVLESGTQSASCDFIQYSEEESIVPKPATGDSADPTRQSWMELPAMNNDELSYYAHKFTMNGISYRNYSFGWSRKDRIALWVAYPLCRTYTNGSVGRTNAWSLDPLLGEDSSAPFGGYGGSYARGHQLPSADRQCCYQANAQTFYGTNMTPQLNEHNEGIWAALESKVRTIAKGSDTTYVVTGVVVSPASRKTRDSYGNDMTIPDAYYKALLYYNSHSTLGQWNAAGFYIEHKEYSGGVKKEYSMSIDKLEEKTGLDFFVNLPAKVGASQADAIEAADPTNVSLWW